MQGGDGVYQLKAPVSFLPMVPRGCQNRFLVCRPPSGGQGFSGSGEAGHAFLKVKLFEKQHVELPRRWFRQVKSQLNDESRSVLAKQYQSTCGAPESVLFNVNLLRQMSEMEFLCDGTPSTASHPSGRCTSNKYNRWLILPLK